MIKSLISINKKLVSNVVSLGFIDLVSMLLPFIYIPLVVQQLGIEIYSSVVWHQSIYLIASVVVQFGFNIYGVAQFHKLNGNLEKQKDLYWVLFFSRIVIFIFLSMLITVIAYVFLDVGGFFLILLGVIYNLGDVFFLRWFCQASGKLHLFALLVASQKVAQMIIVLIILKVGSTEALYLAALTIPYLLFNLLFFWFMAWNIGIFIPSDLRYKIINTFSNAWQYLMSRVIAVTVDKAPIFLLELYGVSGTAGVYDLVMKIIGALQTPFNVVCQAYFSLSFKVKNHKSLFIIVGLCMLGFAFLYMIVLNNPSILKWYFGETYSTAISILKILLWTIGINIVSHNIGNSALIPAGLGTWFNKSVFLSSVFYFFACLYLVLTNMVTVLSVAKLSLFYLTVLMLVRLLIFMILPRRPI